MIQTRWNKCYEIYKKEKINAVIVTYDSIGHEHPQIVKNDILTFIQECIDTVTPYDSE